MHPHHSGRGRDEAEKAPHAGNPGVVPGDSFVGVTLARILRPRGRRGEVAAEILTDFPQRLTTLREAYLWDGTNPPRRVSVRACWLHQQQAIFHFEGSESIDDAARLRGLQVQIPLAERIPLPPGRYYVTDLTGCEVWEHGASQPGPSTSTSTRKSVSGTPLLVIDTPQGELLVPLAEEICPRIDIAERRIEVALPEGLRELNRER
ncbi:MAG: 16S rRNA processing protein RimM [Acidobacteria bacterium]|nr:MAG: 16S rRNA processing protein RimM [Acidobacteriota bacterium]